jgi:Zn-dependent alcohol dehydrogenase
MMRMRAAVLRDIGKPMTVEEVQLDLPHAGEVLVRVAAAGVCHSDLLFAEGGLGTKRLPIVLGHEGAGVVEAVGEGVSQVRPGDHVSFSIVPFCGRCRACRNGEVTLCEPSGEYAYRGTMLDGTMRLQSADGSSLKHFNFVSCFAEYAVVPEASAIPIPRELPLWEAALVGCGVITGFGAVRNVAKVKPGESVCVIGCGGVGLQVVAAAQRAGARPIIAVDRSQEKLDRALAMGATDGVDASRDGAVARIRELSGGGVDHAIEVVGIAATIRQAWDVLRPGATAVVVGLAPRGLEVSIPAIELLSAKGLKGCFYGSGNPRTDIPQLAQMVVDGKLPLREVVSDFTDLKGIDDAFDRMRRGVGSRTIVVVDAAVAGAPAS